MIYIFTENVWENSTLVLISRLLMIQIRQHFFPLIPVTLKSLPQNFSSIGLVLGLNEYYYLILFILLLVCVIIYLRRNRTNKIVANIFVIFCIHMLKCFRSILSGFVFCFLFSPAAAKFDLENPLLCFFVCLFLYLYSLN